MGHQIRRFVAAAWRGLVGIAQEGPRVSEDADHGRAELEGCRRGDFVVVRGPEEAQVEGHSPTADCKCDTASASSWEAKSLKACSSTTQPLRRCRREGRRRCATHTPPPTKRPRSAPCRRCWQEPPKTASRKFSAARSAGCVRVRRNPNRDRKFRREPGVRARIVRPEYVLGVRHRSACPECVPVRAPACMRRRACAGVRAPSARLESVPSSPPSHF